MIKITRPAKVPKILTEKGVIATANDCDAFTNDQVAFLKTFSADPKIYGVKSVKKPLKVAQNNKCCFCEKNQGDEYGAVEHYRPKAGFKKNKKQKTLTKPGYYWLAYDWSNLLFVCSFCNTGYKQNYFELKNDADRAKSHNDSVENEEALLLDPCGAKDPRDHIYFSKQFPMHYDEFGRYTIEYCGLDRDSLNVDRQKLMSDIDARIAILARREHHNALDVEKAKDFILNCTEPKAQFSSMAKDYLAQFNIVRN